MGDETEIARNHLMMIMPVEYKNYIKTILAGDFAFTLRNKLEEQQKQIDKLNKAICIYCREQLGNIEFNGDKGAIEYFIEQNTEH